MQSQEKAVSSRPAVAILQIAKHTGFQTKVSNFPDIPLFSSKLHKNLTTDSGGGDDRSVILHGILTRIPMLLSKIQLLSRYSYWALVHSF